MKKILIIGLLILSGCCETDPNDCTANDLIVKQHQRDKQTVPEYMFTQDNVKVYRVWTLETSASSHWTYFTTPCGNTSAQIEYRTGKTSSTIPVTVNGTGCK